MIFFLGRLVRKVFVIGVFATTAGFTGSLVRESYLESHVEFLKQEIEKEKKVFVPAKSKRPEPIKKAKHGIYKVLDTVSFGMYEKELNNLLDVPRLERLERMLGKDQKRLEKIKKRWGVVSSKE